MCGILGVKVTTTLIKIYISFLYLQKSNVCMRESQDCLVVTHLQIYTRWRDISREPCFFVLLSQDTDSGQPYSLGYSPTPLQASTQNGITLLTDCRLPGLKTYVFSRYLRNSSYIVHVAFPLSLVYLKTQLQVLFSKSTLTSLSKVNLWHHSMTFIADFTYTWQISLFYLE